MLNTNEITVEESSPVEHLLYQSQELAKLFAQLSAPANYDRRKPYLLLKTAKVLSPELDVPEETLAWIDDFTDESRANNQKLKSVRIPFDSVDSFSATYGGKLTSHLMNNGTTTHDNFQIASPKFNFTGYTSDMAENTPLSSLEIADVLKEAWASKLPMFLYMPEISATSIDPATGAKIDNGDYITVFITNLSITRDATMLDGFKISMTLEQPSFYDKIKFLGTEVKVTVVDDTSDKNSKTGSGYYRNNAEYNEGYLRKIEAQNKADTTEEVF